MGYPGGYSLSSWSAARYSDTRLSVHLRVRHAKLKFERSAFAHSCRCNCSAGSPAGEPKFDLVINVGASTSAVELTFLGTRGEIKLRSRRHRRHSSLLVHYNDTRVMIDCGTDWLGRLCAIAPTAIVLTHAHPDHASGLAEGAPCPVYATKETWELLNRYPIHDRHRMPLRKSATIGGLGSRRFQSGIRSGRRPSDIASRLETAVSSILPDVAEFPNASAALRGIDLYIGDGASMRRSMVARRMESQSGTLRSPFSSAGARRQGSALRFSPTAVRSCAVSHAKLKMSCGGSALSVEWRHASPVTGSSCPLRRRHLGKPEVRRCFSLDQMHHAGHPSSGESTRRPLAFQAKKQATRRVIGLRSKPFATAPSSGYFSDWP